MGRQKTTGSRTSYGPEIDGMLSDYCAAVDGLPERNFVRAAIRHYIQFQIDENEGIKKRYEENRMRRLSNERPNFQVIKGDD